MLDELIEQVRQDRPRLFDDESIIEANNFDYDQSGQTAYSSNSTSSGGISWGSFLLGFLVVIFLGYQLYQWYESDRQRDPQTFIVTYHELLQSNRFSRAWELTSGDYRISKYPQGQSAYADYYGNWTKIEVVTSEILEQVDNTATVSIPSPIYGSTGA